MRPVCLITGVGGRLGQALCSAMADTHDIVATYRTTLPPITSQMQRRLARGDTATTGSASEPAIHLVRADLTQRGDVQRLVEVALARFGRIDALVNSAADGVFHGDLRELWDAGDYAQAQLSINSIVPIQLASAIHQLSWKHEPDENVRWNRCVVNVSSVSGLYVLGDRRQAFYGASKAALNMLTQYLALELARYGVRVNAVCPSRFRTAPATERVVASIVELLQGQDTGTIVTGIP